MSTTRAIHALHVLLLCLVVNGPAQARTFQVNANSDVPDFAPGDNLCSIFPPEQPPICTLRAAIMEANAVPVADEIFIQQGLHIVLGANLPTIIQPLTISGPDAIILDTSLLPAIDGAFAFRPITVATTDVFIRDLRVINGAGQFGGGLRVQPGASASVQRVQFTSNAADFDGGAVFSQGSLTIEQSDFNMNEAIGGEGASIFSGVGDSLTVRRTSIRRSRSSSETREAVFIEPDGIASFENVMIDGADSQPGATGSGGIRAEQPDELRLNHVTLVNHATDGLRLITGAGNNGVTSLVRVRNSILAGASGDDCSLTAGGSPSIEFAYVLVQDGGCAGFLGGTGITGVAPNLSAQQSTSAQFYRFRTPLRPSPAIDAGDPDPMSPNACLSADMRGTPRPLEGDAMGATPRCDLGAIEAPLFSQSIYVVNTGIDGVDDDPGDDVCETGPGSGLCTLRAAVMEANAKPGPDIIAFDDQTLAVDLDLANSAGAEGGDLDITEALVITGSPVDLLDVAIAGEVGGQTARVRIGQERAGERIFEVLTGESVTFSRLELAPDLGFGPLVPSSGGAVRIGGGGNVTMTSVDIHANRSDLSGGGVSVIDGHLNLEFSDLWSNEAASTGAALFIGTNGSADVDASSFWANRISDGLPATREAIYVQPGGELSIANSTVAFNEGGITAPNPAMVEIVQSTIAYNDVRGLDASFGSPGYNESLTIRSSIFANNAQGDCLIEGVDDAEILSRNEVNLDASGSDCAVGASNIVADPALVVPPPGGGGVVILERPEGQLTRVLRPLHAPDFYDNPALDAVPAGLACLASDQLGTPRPQQLPFMTDGAGTCDIGAIEVIAEPRPDAIFADGFEES